VAKNGLNIEEIDAMTELTRIPKCNRCGGTGMHTHGVCYGCNGLGIPVTNDYLPYKKRVATVVSELGKAEIIIQVMLNVMTIDQKAAVAAQIEASGVSPEEMVRGYERRSALAAFGE
jgi:hypothetical protein